MAGTGTEIGTTIETAAEARETTIETPPETETEGIGTTTRIGAAGATGTGTGTGTTIKTEAAGGKGGEETATGILSASAISWEAGDRASELAPTREYNALFSTKKPVVLLGVHSCTCCCSGLYQPHEHYLPAISAIELISKMKIIRNLKTF